MSYQKNGPASSKNWTLYPAHATQGAALIRSPPGVASEMTLPTLSPPLETALAYSPGSQHSRYFPDSERRSGRPGLEEQGADTPAPSPICPGTGTGPPSSGDLPGGGDAPSPPSPSPIRPDAPPSPVPIGGSATPRPDKGPARVRVRVQKQASVYYSCDSIN